MAGVAALPASSKPRRFRDMDRGRPCCSGRAHQNHAKTRLVASCSAARRSSTEVVRPTRPVKQYPVGRAADERHIGRVEHLGTDQNDVAVVEPQEFRHSRGKGRSDSRLPVDTDG